MVRVDAFSIFFHLVILLIALVVILSSFDYLEVQRIKAGEYYGLILFATVGMMLMSSAIELVLIFIGLEISSISTYIMAGFRRRAAETRNPPSSTSCSVRSRQRSSCTALRWCSGPPAPPASPRLPRASPPATPHLAMLALALMIIGLGFKVSAAPFHVWTPDVYQGAPAPVVGSCHRRPRLRPLRCCCASCSRSTHRWVLDPVGARPCSR